MENNINMKDAGLLCDNENCDWTDPTVTMEQMGDWINRPCPSCGCNLLTLEDYNNVTSLLEAVKLINSMTPEQLQVLTKNMDIEEVKQSEFFKNSSGLDLLIGESQNITVSVNTHKTIKATEIFKSES